MYHQKTYTRYLRVPNIFVNRRFHFSVNISGQLVVAGVLLIAAPFSPLYSGFIDWPGAIGFSVLGLGGISVGSFYVLGGLYGSLDSIRATARFGTAVLGVLLLVPVLVTIYWLCGHLGVILQTTRLDVLVFSAFAYLPVALGVPVGRTTNHNHQLGLLLLAGVFVTLPAYRTLQIVLASGGFVQIVPVGWIATLVYDGLFAYPLYRFAKRRNVPPE